MTVKELRVLLSVYPDDSPVFWNESTEHDFAEVSHVKFTSEDGTEDTRSFHLGPEP